MTKYLTMDAYIADCTSEMRPKMEQMRRILQEALPDARECISYNMPAFKTAKVLVYFAAGKNHIGFYPTPEPITHFHEELCSYKTSKGAIQFPKDQPLPEELICRIARYRLDSL